MTTKQAKQKRQNRLGAVLAILIFLLGLGILFYPVASDLWNQHRQNQLISHYTPKHHDPCPGGSLRAVGSGAGIQ